MQLILGIGAALVGFAVWSAQRIVNQLDKLSENVSNLNTTTNNLEEILERQERISGVQWKKIDEHTKEIARLKAITNNGK